MINKLPNSVVIFMNWLECLNQLNFSGKDRTPKQRQKNRTMIGKPKLTLTYVVKIIGIFLSWLNKANISMAVSLLK